MFIKIKDIIIDARTVKMLRLSGKVITIHAEYKFSVNCKDEDEAKKEFDKAYDGLNRMW